MTNSLFEEQLDTYADIIVRVAVGLRDGQRLLIRAPLEAAPLVRLVVAHAYRNGARLVDVIWIDPPSTLARYKYAPRDSFSEVSQWPVKAGIEFAERGDAILTVAGTDPDLLAGQDPALIAQSRLAESKAAAPYLDYIISDATNWSIVAAASEPWAARVFPNAVNGDAMQQLWTSIFDICRVPTADPVAAWHAHDKMLNARADFLTGKHYAAIRLVAPGTDLTVGLADGHRWMGGGSTAANGVHGVANVPTEEVFTTPHRERTEGTVRASMPLNYGGSLIEDFQVTFRDGRVVEVSAGQGQALLQSLVDMDEGSSRLGELALVPNSSPIAQSGVLFYNTLFDENAACHVALGRAYEMCVENGTEMSAEEFAAAGGNTSLTHVDFMIGSADMDVDGITAEGAVEPLMRAGEFVAGPR